MGKNKLYKKLPYGEYKFDKEQVNLMLANFKTGIPVNKLARQYGVPVKDIEWSIRIFGIFPLVK